MDPLTLAFLGSTAVSGLGSILGAGESSKTQQANKDIAMLNYNQKERERQQALDLADRARDDSHQGYTDANGNTIRFVPGQGWVTTVSPESKAIIDAQNKQLLDTINIDEVRRRAQEGRNETQRVDQGAEADRLLSEFRNTRPTDPKEMEALLYNKATRGLNDAFSARASQASTDQLRRNGGANLPAIYGALAKEQGQQQGYAAEDAALNALKFATDDTNSRRGNLAQLYSAFADRASRVPGSTYQPTDPTKGITSALPGLTQDAGLNDRAAINAAGKEGGTMPYQQPDMGLANAFASIGTMGANIAGKYLTADQYSKNLKNAGSGYITENNYYSS